MFGRWSFLKTLYQISNKLSASLSVWLEYSSFQTKSNKQKTNKKQERKKKVKAIIFNGRFFRLSALVAAMLVSPILGGCLTAKNGKTLGIFSHMSTLYVLDERSEKPEDRRPSPFQVVIDNQTGVEIALESVANKGTSYDKPLYIPEDISGAVIQVRPEPAGGYSYRLEIELSASAENSKKVVYRRFSFDHYSDGYTLYSGRQIFHWVLTAEDFAVKPSRR